MHFVMAKSMAASGGLDGAQGGQWQQGNWEEHGPRHNGGWRGRGRGNYAGGRGGHGNYRDGAGHALNVTEQCEPSYAVALHGDVEPPAGNDQDEKNMLHDSAGGKSGGRMQRVGDKWMFVRDVEP